MARDARKKNHGDGKVSKIFTPVILEQLKKHVSRSLTDTFNLMFNLNLSACAVPPAGGSDKTQKAYVEFTGGKTTAFLNATIPDHIVKAMVATLGLPEGQYTPAVAQDITCEILNIVGHAVCTFLTTQQGVRFHIGLPKPGTPQEKTPVDAETLSVHFLGTAEAIMNLDFVYSKSA